MTTQTTKAPVPTRLDALAASNWRVDPEASSITFRTRTMLGLLKVEGSFKVTSGTLAVSARGDVAGSLRVDAASVQTGIAKRDNHLRSADFFHAAEHPHFDFTLSSISSQDAGTHAFAGDLEIRGRRLPLAAPLTIEAAGGDRLHLSTTADADHGAAGFKWTKPGMIRGRIPVSAEIVLVRDRG